MGPGCLDDPAIVAAQDRVIEAFVGALEAQTGRRTRSL